MISTFIMVICGATIGYMAGSVITDHSRDKLHEEIQNDQVRLSKSLDQIMEKK